MAAGNEHTLILTEGGDLYSSGYNEIASSSTSSGGGSASGAQGVNVISGAVSNSLGGQGVNNNGQI